MNDITMKLQADRLIKMALAEDISDEDVSTNSVMPKACPGKVDLIAKEDGVIAGLDVFARVFTILDEDSKVEFYVSDGDHVTKGQKMAVVYGDIRVLLSGERTALNYLQRMSGIATYTRKVADLLSGSKTKLLDTRKTTPNNRLFEKYAVRVGGGNNHRYNLSDAAMLKDNHVDAGGGIKNAVAKLKSKLGHMTKIELEVRNLDELRQALEAKVDVIMLDNMSCEMMREAVEITNGQAMLEASGGITDETLRDIAETGVDIISMGAITHSVTAFDISLKISD